MKISVLQHAANEDAGQIARWAGERGHSLRVHHLYLRDAPPDIDVFDLLVVMGGEMNIYQDRDYPWLKPERQLVRTALAADKPLVGICLGSQFIADALGSRITQNPQHEIGWFPVRFTSAALREFPEVPQEIMALHWHGDTFELPSGATRLAASDACPEQGFFIRRQCLALQFHFETDAPLVREMVQGSSDYSHWPKGPYVQPPETILADAEKYCQETRSVLFHLLDTFVGPPAPSR